MKSDAMNTTSLRFDKKLLAYLALTKPTIQLLVVLTGAAALVYEGSLTTQPLKFLWVMVLLAMAGGAANAFNQVFERDVDSNMRRTAKRRPLPLGHISLTGAYLFAGSLAVGSTIGFWLSFNWLSAVLAGVTILFYSLFYTLYLKPRTPQNIVIGGAAGSMGPVITLAAATGEVSLAAWLMFAIIFFWTPPHFWSLAIYYKEDYREVGYPMMPLVIGETRTWASIMRYTIITILISVGLYFTGAGVLYLLAALILGGFLLRKTIEAQKTGSPQAARGVFGISIVYLLALFTALIVDHSIYISIF
ncbi:heme o synthase [bacterium]|nr:heme o synthase [bacterium]